MTSLTDCLSGGTSAIKSEKETTAGVFLKVRGGAQMFLKVRGYEEGSILEGAWVGLRPSRPIRCAGTHKWVLKVSREALRAGVFEGSYSNVKTD